MSLIYADRVEETSLTVGTSPYVLSGAVLGSQSFAIIGDGNTCYYCAAIVDTNGVPIGDWEVGLGTYAASGPTLARTTILASSNSNAAVNWGAGTKRVFVVQPAAVISLLVTLAGDNTFTGTNVFNGHLVKLTEGWYTPFTTNDANYTTRPLSFADGFSTLGLEANWNLGWGLTVSPDLTSTATYNPGALGGGLVNMDMAGTAAQGFAIFDSAGVTDVITASYNSRNGDATDLSAYGSISNHGFAVFTNGTYKWVVRPNGVLTGGRDLTASPPADYSLLPGFKSVTTVMHLRLGDDSADADFHAKAAIFTGTVTATDFIVSGSAFKTDTTTGHTALFQAYDVDGAAYATFATLTNGNTPSFALAAPAGGSLTGDFSTLKVGGTNVLTSVTAHNVLSTTHGDATAGTVARGDVITGQGATPTWTRLAKGTANQVLAMDGTATDVAWTTLAAGGSVTSVSVTTANGVSGSVATATTTPEITLTLGAITPTTVNGNTFTTGTYTLTGQAGKTLTFNGSITLTGTDAQTYTFPTTSATIARTDAANTFTGVQTMTAPVFNTSASMPSVITAAGTALSLAPVAPATAGTSTAGAGITVTASNATAGNVTAGAAAGGAITLTAGDAARLTSGNAAGGAITLKTGKPIGGGAKGDIIFLDWNSAEAGRFSMANNQLWLGNNVDHSTSSGAQLEVCRSAANSLGGMVLSNTNGSGNGNWIEFSARESFGSTVNKQSGYIQLAPTGAWTSAPVVTSAMIFATIAAETVAERARFDVLGLTLADAHDLIVGSTTGTKVGTATSQKLGFWNTTPIVQPVGAGQAAFTDSTGGTPGASLVDVGAIFSEANINNNFATVSVLLLAIRTALVNSGLMKGAA